MLTIYRVGQKRTVLRVDNFAMVNGRKACDMSKVSEFYVEKVQYLHMNAFKYSLHSLHKLSLHIKLC